MNIPEPDRSLKKKVISQAEWDDLITKPCFLDGKVAAIKGRLLEFPFVCSVDKQVEFSWKVIERIINKGGCFQSK